MSLGKLKMKAGFPICFGYNVVVLAVIAVLALVLGLLNNSRFEGEQRVPLFGDVVE